jgi:hypothetical protein
VCRLRRWQVSDEFDNDVINEPHTLNDEQSPFHDGQIPLKEVYHLNFIPRRLPNTFNLEGGENEAIVEDDGETCA